MSDNVTEQGNPWIARRYLDELSINFRTAWDLYIKWYTVFLPFQLTALGLTLKYIECGRWPIVVAFVVQNMFSAGTALFMSYYSRSSEARMQRLSKLIVSQATPAEELSSQLAESSLPSGLAFWAGWANAIAHVTFIGCWIAVGRMES